MHTYDVIPKEKTSSMQNIVLALTEDTCIQDFNENLFNFKRYKQNVYFTAQLNATSMTCYDTYAITYSGGIQFDLIYML